MYIVPEYPWQQYGCFTVRQGVCFQKELEAASLFSDTASLALAQDVIMYGQT